VSDVIKKLVAGIEFSFSENVRFQPKAFDENIVLHKLEWDDPALSTI
jgi:hypothetical protein